MQSTEDKQRDFVKVRETTERELLYFRSDLEIYDLLNGEAPYSLDKGRHLQMLIRMLSRNRRSVQITHLVLQVIFKTRDAELLVGQPAALLECIVQKFKLLHDLAITLKMPVQDLIRFAPDEVCGKLAYYLMLSGDTVNVIEYYLSVQYFKGVVLPRAWFYLITTQKITHEKLQETLLKVKFKDHYLLSLQELKFSLYECLAQIAYTSKLTSGQKKNALSMLKSTFGFASDQEFIQLYNFADKKHGQFESRFLASLMKKLTYGKRYYLEKLIARHEKEKTAPFYVKKLYIAQEFYKTSGELALKKTRLFLDALDFVNREIKKGQTLPTSDFAVAFLNAFSFLFPQALVEGEPMARQGKLMQFITTVQLLIKNGLAEDEYFKASIVNMTIYVLKLAIESEDTVEVAIFSMQILLNANGLKESMPYLSKFCSIAVQAYLRFPDKAKIKKYTSKIVHFYISEKIRFTQGYFKDLQFLMLKRLQEVPALRESIQIISQHLYCTPDTIAENLKYLVGSLQTGNEDIRLLNTSYLLELLEQAEQSAVRKVLVSAEILKITYQGLLEMPQDYKQAKSRQLSVVTAKCIAAIGLCQPFVNDPLTLKATNQTTLVGKKKTAQEAARQATDESAQHSGIIKSDYFNPLTNLQKYKQSGQDNTLEYLAVPSLNDLQIERDNVIDFAENLLRKVAAITNLTDAKPQNFFYSQFLIDMFIVHQRLIAEPANEALKDKHQKQTALAKSIARYAPSDLTEYTVLGDDCEPSRFNRRLCLHLITKIEEKSWRELFEACVPLLKTQNEVLEVLLPYIMYYALRFNHSDGNLPMTLATAINRILSSEYYSQIAPILKAQDFIRIADQQDKRVFKSFIENDTKFKYVEKLFKIDYDVSKAKDQNVVNFIKVIDQSPIIKHSFLVVKKIEVLLAQVDKTKKIRGAKLIKAFQRCVYNFEESFRGAVKYGFLDVLTADEAREIVHLHKQLSPEDFDYGIFNSIAHKQQKEKAATIEDGAALAELYASYVQKGVVDMWRNGQFDYLTEWTNGFDIGALSHSVLLLDREVDDPVQKFEFLMALFLAEYARGLKAWLHGDNQSYLVSLCKVNHFFELLYQEFILSLDHLQGEISYYYKLFLHVLYEVESFVHYLKDAFFADRERLSELLKKETVVEKRRFEKLFLDYEMTPQFERLLGWLEERSQTVSNSMESLKLIYFVRRALFKLVDREQEYAFYLMKLARLYRKSSNDVLEVNKLYKECEQYAHKIVDYELEYAKYTLKTKNAHEAYQYLLAKNDVIKEKCDQLYKASRSAWQPARVHEKAVLLSIELQIKIDPQNPQIIKRFDEFLKQMTKTQWEKPVFRYAQFLDELDSQGPPIHLQKEEIPDPKKRTIQKIYYYITSLKYGYKYIWQSFPRALELWFDYNERETDVERINNFMKQELYRLEVFKLASVLQILLSRYAHTKEQVRDIIMIVLSKIAIRHPGQCSWWIYHFLHFDQDAMKKPQPIKAAVSRHEFAKQLIGKIMAQDANEYKKILECEKIFLELKKLSEKAPPQQNSSTIEIPQALQKITSSSLVMPIEENLSPQLPNINFRINFVQTCIVQTTSPIDKFNPANIKKMGPQSETPASEQATPEGEEFPAFKANPILIAGFLPEATIMISKEKPKKIGIIGTNKQVYNFLLKCDKYGDLRKEQRFIDFAVLCNKMLENDAESRKRNLRLRTYAIVPLSRSTGLIEWIQNTSTLKTIVGEQWKKNNIKGEMQDIKQRAVTLKLGENHEQIWDKVKEEIKPVLGSWMADHFPSPEIWYEARINFVRSTAIWSMIGYVIGLGDRHGDNILIHQHTGEVTHVDFDCIFEKGAKLKIPEIVPFRLTQNIMEAFGIFKEKGVFQRNCEAVMRVLRRNSKNIVSFLDSFIHDPLIESQQNIKVEIKQALDVVKSKLHGQIKGDQSGSVTVEEQVEQVVLHAINDDSLRKMYIGWMPWL